MIICLKDKNTLEIVKISGVLDYKKHEYRLVHRSRYDEDGYRLLKKKRSHKKYKSKSYRKRDKNFNNDVDLQKEDDYPNSLQYEENVTCEDYSNSYDKNTYDNESYY